MGLGISIRVNGTADASLSGASSVEIRERAGEATRYRLHYPIGVVDTDFASLLDARIGPESEISIVVPIDGVNQHLVKGPVHAQNVRIDHGAGDSWMEVLGADGSIAMDREVHAKVWPSTTASAAVADIVGQYGFQTDVEDTPATFEEAAHALVQHDTDLRFVRRLARRHGYQFWLTTEPDGRHTAHFRRPALDAAPAFQLRFNKSGETPHVTWLDLSWDVERPTRAQGLQLDVLDKSDIDGQVPKQPLPLLGLLDLAAVAPSPRSIDVVAPTDDLGDLQARSEGALIDASWFTRASCATTFALTRTLIRAHSIVEIAGAGTRHSGKYFVAGVRHQIDSKDHRMELELVRNAWSA